MNPRCIIIGAVLVALVVIAVRKGVIPNPMPKGG